MGHLIKRPARFPDAFSICEAVYERNSRAGRGSDILDRARVGLTRKQLLWIADYFRKEGGRGSEIRKAGAGHYFVVLNSFPPRDVPPEQRPYWAGAIKKIPVTDEN